MNDKVKLFFFQLMSLGGLVFAFFAFLNKMWTGKPSFVYIIFSILIAVAGTTAENNLGKKK